VWIFIADSGFFSVVEQRDNPKLLRIRARVKGDLENLKKNYLPNLGPVATMVRSDYPYCALAWRPEFAVAMAKVAQNINYDNFKNEVTKQQGADRHDLYMEVWSVMNRAESFLKGLYKKSYNYVKSATGSWDSENWGHGNWEPEPKGKKKHKHQKGNGKQLEMVVESTSAFPVDINSEWSNGEHNVIVRNRWESLEEGTILQIQDVRGGSWERIKLITFVVDYWPARESEGPKEGRVVSITPYRGELDLEGSKKARNARLARKGSLVLASEMERHELVEETVTKQLQGGKDDFDIEDLPVPEEVPYGLDPTPLLHEGIWAENDGKEKS